MDVFLLEVQVPSGHIRPIELSVETRDGCDGIVGLTSFPGGYIGLLHPNKLFYLSGDLEVQQVRKLEMLSDAHSVSYHEGYVYVVSTGTDQIIRVARGGATEVFWQASDADTDTVHLNSLLWHNDQCLVSAFGPKKENLWRSADEGYVFNISTGEYLMKNIYHPHSLAVINGELWVCESSRLAVVNYCGTRIETPWGYLRGLCEKDGFLYVGSTFGRNKSKSTGQIIDNQADAGIRSGVCGIGVIDLRGSFPQIVNFIDLSAYAEEIYDVVALQNCPQWRTYRSYTTLRTDSEYRYERELLIWAKLRSQGWPVHKKLKKTR